MFARILSICLLSTTALTAADWPQHLGPLRTGHSGEAGLLNTWPADARKINWKIEGGVGM